MTDKKTQEEKLSFEEALERMQQVVQALETGDVPLSEAIGLYEKGMAYARMLESLLSDAQSRISKLEESRGQWSETPLDIEENV
ncbi:MAG: exodeoxyribonuclease VII small subunit [Christensenellales bacterium]|jgi:exodeoxyribonuclease VII small subunit